jgi:Rrf2 family iron-sulfur cluster assembly transcriptional regulator
MRLAQDHYHVLSQTTEHALRAFIYIARVAPRSVQLTEIAEAVDAPPRYLAKILSQLVHHRYLSSTRGPTGGFSLVARHSPVTLGDIADVFQEATPSARCLLGSGPCGRNPDCPVHQRWAPIASSMSSFLSRTTVAELVPTRPSTT